MWITPQYSTICFYRGGAPPLASLHLKHSIQTLVLSGIPPSQVHTCDLLSWACNSLHLNLICILLVHVRDNLGKTVIVVCRVGEGWVINIREIGAEGSICSRHMGGCSAMCHSMSPYILPLHCTQFPFPTLSSIYPSHDTLLTLSLG